MSIDGDQGDTRHAKSSTAGLILAVVSLAIMPTLVYAKQQTSRALASRALEADAVLRGPEARGAAASRGALSVEDRRVELRCGGDTEAEESSWGLLLREGSLELRSRLLPRASLERCLPSFERTRDLAFRRTFRVPRARPDERDG